MTQAFIQVEGLYKVFGAHEQRALDYLHRGEPDREVFLSRGWSLALDNVSFKGTAG